MSGAVSHDGWHRHELSIDSNYVAFIDLIAGRDALLRIGCFTASTDAPRSLCGLLRRFLRVASIKNDAAYDRDKHSGEENDPPGQTTTLLYKY